MTSLLHAAFFASGVAALLFETLWFHQAALAFGNSVWASSVVLAGFMGGLGVGNALAARHGHRARRPLWAYSVLECTVGISGVAIVALLPSLGPWLAPAVRPLEGAPWALNVFRLAASFGILLVPTTAMGATLPLLVKAVSARDENFGRVLGRLYGWNTAGAVVGAVVGDAVLIGWLGIRGSAMAAGGVSAAAAAAALGLAWRGGGRDSRAGAPPPEPLWAGLPVRARRVLGAAFLAGGVLLALEVIWFRFLLLFVHGSSLAFALMLATVLAGIAAGGLLSSLWLGRRPDASGAAAAIACLGGILCVAGYAGFRFLVPTSDVAYVSSWGATLVRSALLMFPVSACSGALFPLFGTRLRELRCIETRAAGLVTLANTLGAALGSLIGGFALLPLVGVETSLFVLAFGYAAVAVLVLPTTAAVSRVPRLAPLAALAVALLLFPFGAMDEHYLRLPIERYERPGETRVAGIREAVTETIIVLEYEKYGEPQDYRLITNGYSMSGMNPFAKRYMKLYVYWPVALRPDPKSALLISYGIGTTAKALTDTASFETIDVVDISEDILEMSDLVFADPDSHPLRDPRVRIHIEDGRQFLQTTDRHFDVITSEPPPPKKAGIVHLYTREYFELVRERLTEGGVATYWLPVHGLQVSDTKAIIRGFCDAFDDCSLWNGMRFDWMLVGTRNLTGRIDEQAFSRQWRDPVVREELRATGLETPAQLGALFIADWAALRILTRDTLPLTDDWPMRLSREPPGASSIAIHRMWTDTRLARQRFAGSRYIAGLWPADLKRRTFEAFEAQRVLNGQLFHSAEAGERAIADLAWVLRETELTTLPLWLLGSTVEEQRTVDRLWRADGAASQLDYRRALGAVAAREYDRAEDLFRRAATYVGQPLVEETGLLECLRASPGSGRARCGGIEAKSPAAAAQPGGGLAVPVGR